MWVNLGAKHEILKSHFVSAPPHAQNPNPATEDREARLFFFLSCAELSSVLHLLIMSSSVMCIPNNSVSVASPLRLASGWSWPILFLKQPFLV